jgi:hypothetical protein
MAEKAVKEARNEGGGTRQAIRIIQNQVDMLRRYQGVESKTSKYALAVILEQVTVLAETENLSLQELAESLLEQ